jgi:hypothetical protein
MLFLYARMETDETPSKPMLNDMRTAATLCGFELLEWTELDAKIRRRYPEPDALFSERGSAT